MTLLRFRRALRPPTAETLRWRRYVEHDWKVLRGLLREPTVDPDRVYVIAVSLAHWGRRLLDPLETQHA